MSERTIQPIQELRTTTRSYVGALIPLRLYHLLVEEAERAKVSRSEVLRRALAERYGEATADPSVAAGQEKEQEA